MHHHYLTIEQRETLAQLIRSHHPPGSQRLQTELERLHQPDYGVCIECRKDIGFARLEADPTALHCRECALLPVGTMTARPVPKGGKPEG
jgi:RNA polymerase-binding transcription factor DksA